MNFIATIILFEKGSGFGCVISRLCFLKLTSIFYCYRTERNFKLLFSIQMPVVPLQRPDELNIPSPSWMQTSSGFEDVYNEQGIPTMITWSYGGKEVSVEGSWDSWKSRLILLYLVS